jgi:hypothetical protein
MALKKTVITIYGFVASDAYHRIENIKFQGKDVINFSVKSYKDNLANVPFTVVELGCAYELSGNNPFVQAYNYLKTTSEFAGATDC